MPALDSSALLWILGGVQLLGMTSALVARLSAGSVYEALFQRFFFLGFFLMGLATMINVATRPGMWLMSAVTLSLSLLVVVCDFRQSERSARIMSEF